MTEVRTQGRTRLATRLAFLAAGFGLASWAPLVPFARDRVGVDEGALGLLLLCLGVGSVTAMTLTGMFSARWGVRPVIVLSGLLMAVTLPFLAIAASPVLLGLALFLFGAGLGSLDVAMNIHAVDVEKAGDTPLMSGFHALFSIGGFSGAAVVTGLLSLGMSPVFCAVVSAMVVGVATLAAWPRLSKAKGTQDGPLFAIPRGIVLLLAVLAAAAFLAEGALLDWSALLITDAALVPVTQGGLGYLVFSIAMTIGRLFGDRVTARLGDQRVLFWGGLVAVSGFVLLLLAPNALIALGGFVLIGLGASNIVPVLFRLAGAQTIMPSGLAIAAVTTTGYAGVLIGPAGVGAIAHVLGLPAAYWVVAALVALVPIFAATATKTAARS